MRASFQTHERLSSSYLVYFGSPPHRDHPEEAALLTRAQQGDPAARDSLCRYYGRYAIDIARKFRLRGVLFDDLVQAAMLGLLEAINHFDFTRDRGFTACLCCYVRQAIYNEFARTNTIWVPKGTFLQMCRARRQAKGHTSQLPERLRDAYNALDWQRTDDDWDLTLVSPSTMLSATAEGLLVQEAAADWQRALAYLAQVPPRERQAIELFFGLDRAGVTRQLREVSGIMELSRERVRQLKAAGFARIHELIARETDPCP